MLLIMFCYICWFVLNGKKVFLYKYIFDDRVFIIVFYSNVLYIYDIITLIVIKKNMRKTRRD